MEKIKIQSIEEIVKLTIDECLTYFKKVILENDYYTEITRDVVRKFKNTSQTIEKNKTVLTDLYKDCKDVEEFIKIVSEHFELK